VGGREKLRGGDPVAQGDLQLSKLPVTPGIDRRVELGAFVVEYPVAAGAGGEVIDVSPGGWNTLEGPGVSTVEGDRRAFGLLTRSLKHVVTNRREASRAHAVSWRRSKIVQWVKGIRDDGTVMNNDDDFAVLCEIEPATTPDLRRVRRQIVAFDGVTDLFLIPDNHIGRATVSSIAVAREVADLGGRAIACVNSRDRNLLGFRRDLLTAAAYGVRDFLFVRGDDPIDGGRSDLTVRRMLDEARAYPDATFSLGVTARCGTEMPRWKGDADFWLVQACYDAEKVIAWRQGLAYTGAVYAGVLVMASAKMARRIAVELPEINVPDELITALEHDRDAGVHQALDLVATLQESGAFDGVHLVPVGRYQQIATLMRHRASDGE
jgi:methylenetetrahydrofolate reductase (NADPH)